MVSPDVLANDRVSAVDREPGGQGKNECDENDSGKRRSHDKKIQLKRE